MDIMTRRAALLTTAVRRPCIVLIAIYLRCYKLCRYSVEMSCCSNGMGSSKKRKEEKKKQSQVANK